MPHISMKNPKKTIVPTREQKLNAAPPFFDDSNRLGYANII